MPVRRGGSRSGGWSGTLHCCALGFALIATVLLVYGPIVRNDFVNWDDDLHITYNPHFNPVSLGNTFQFWRQPYYGLYIPVSYTFFAAEAWLATLPPDAEGRPQFAPSVFHAGSLLLHGACALLVFVLLRRLITNDWAALAGALLFALHPLQAESVAWASETRGLLAAMFSLLALWAWTLFSKDPTRRRWRLYGLATLAFALALLSKPSAAATPLVAAVLSLAWYRHGWRQTALSLAPWVLIVVLISLLTQHLQSKTPMLYVPPGWARPLIASDALAFYLGKLFVPHGLIAHYDRGPQAVMQRAMFPWIWIVPTILAAALWWRPRKEFLTGAGLFVAGLLPVLGLVPFAYQDYSTVADRYAYLALLGPALLLATWLSKPEHGTLKAAISALALLLCAGLTYAQVQRWRNSETLFAHNLVHNPRSEVARDNYASYLIANNRPSEALTLSEQSLRLDPRSSKAHSNLAAALEALNQPQRALTHRRLAVECDPAQSQMHINLADALSRGDQASEAEAAYREALRLEPEALVARYNLGILLQAQGRHTEAAAEFQHVIERHPDDYRARMNLGLALVRSGRLNNGAAHFQFLVDTTGDLAARVQLAEAYVSQDQMPAAMLQYREALREPSASWPQIAGRVAWLLATHPDSTVRDGRQALVLAQEACRQTNNQRADLLRAWAAALAETADFGTAQEKTRVAERIANSQANAQLVENLRGDLDLYRAGQPVRAPP